MTVAICISGQLREKYTHTFIRYLRENVLKYNHCHVFACISDGASEGCLLELQSLNPEAVQVVPLRNTRILGFSPVLSSMFEKIHICNSMAQKHSTRYTCHVRIRPDFIIKEPWIFSVGQRNTLHTIHTLREINLVLNQWMTDQFFYGSPKVMLMVCNLCINAKHSMCRECIHIPESVLTDFVKEQDIRIVRHRMDCEPVLSYRNIPILWEKIKTGHVCITQKTLGVITVILSLLVLLVVIHGLNHRCDSHQAGPAVAAQAGWWW